MNNKYQVINLPHWVLTDEHVAMYDSEAKTAIQMVARLYSAMQDLQNTYNLFESEYQALMDEAIDYLHTNLLRYSNEIFYNALNNGDIDVNLHEEYNEEDESLSLSIRGDYSGN